MGAPLHCFAGSPALPSARRWLRGAGISRCQFTSSGYVCPTVARADVRHRGIFAMAAPGGDRVLWADSISQTYDGERYQFKDVSLSVQLGAKIAVLGGNGGSFVFPSMPSTLHLLHKCN